MTKNGRLRRWNERVLAVSGYTDKELDGMDVTELFVEEHRERITKSIDDPYENGCV